MKPELSIENILIFLGLLFIAMLILREIFCWYWKINEVASQLKTVNANLKEIYNAININTKEVQKINSNSPTELRHIFKEVNLKDTKNAKPNPYEPIILNNEIKEDDPYFADQIGTKLGTKVRKIKNLFKYGR